MNDGDTSGGNGAAGTSPVSALFYPEDPSAWTSREVLRLLLVPTIATLLFVGGIYWIRLQPPAGPSSREQSSVVQVRLLPRPSPAPIPLATVSEPAAAALASRTDLSTDNSESATDSTVPTPEPVPAEQTVPTPRPVPQAADAPPNSVAIKFQQALLRHVARYKRYPSAARLGRLHGAVETLFSMQRDGTLVDVWVKTSSGQAVLDKAALEAIRRAQPLPSIPSELPGRLTIQIWLEFDPS